MNYNMTQKRPNIQMIDFNKGHFHLPYVTLHDTHKKQDLGDTVDPDGPTSSGSYNPWAAYGGVNGGGVPPRYTGMKRGYSLPGIPGPMSDGLQQSPNNVVLSPLQQMD